MNKQKGTFASIYSFAEQAKGKMAASILCAIISVAGGLLPYLGVYRIILVFFDGDPSMEQILPWVLLCASGYVVKQLFHGITSLSCRIAHGGFVLPPLGWLYSTKNGTLAK